MSERTDDTPRLRRRRWLLVGAVAAVVVVAGSVAVVRARSPRPPRCYYQILQERALVPRTPRLEWPVEDTDPVWDPVRIADWDHDRYWRFVRNRTNAGGEDGIKGVLEGVFKPWTEADVTETWWTLENPADKQRTRDVVTATDQWFESTKRGDRTHCPMKPEWEIERFIPGEYPNPGQESARWIPVIAGPNESGRLIGEEQQDGEPLRVFELQPGDDAPRAQTTLVVDAGDRIRRLEVKDSADGTVLFDLKVWPAPTDQPPIGDPSGQPIVSVP